ncbi:MAG: 2OG-Fe(II) oxygenase, partial [Nannocystaceae bacterium]
VNERIRFYKYLPGQRFLGHRDGRVKVRGLISRLSFLVYLNADFEGGETTFRTLGASEAQLGVPQLPIRVVPQVGDALLFEHHHWHEGTRVTSGIKYVMRSDIFYKPSS